MPVLSGRSRYAVNALHEENSIAQRLERKGKRIIRLNQGDPPLYFPTPKYTVDAYVKALRQGRTGYSDFPGIGPLREAIARKHRKQGVPLDPEDVIVTAGVSGALQFLNEALVSRGDSAILFRPYYTVYIPWLGMSGGAPIFEDYDERDNWNIGMEHVRASLRRLKQRNRLKRVKYMLITNPNNPTGTVLRHSIIKEIVDLANEYDILLVSDEIYDEIVYNGATFTSIGRLARGMPHVILNGASKNYDATGFRIGYAAIPERDGLSMALKRAFSDFASVRISSSTPAQYAFADAMNNEAEHRRELRKMVNSIESRVNFAMKLLDENPYLSTVEPNGAFYIFPRVDLRSLGMKDDAAFTRKLLGEEYVQVVRGSGFGSPNHFRMIALPPKAELELAIDRINRFCRRHAR